MPQSEAKRKWYQENAERIKAKKAQHYLQNKDKIKQKRSEHYAVNRWELLDKAKQYYDEKKDSFLLSECFSVLNISEENLKLFF